MRTPEEIKDGLKKLAKYWRGWMEEEQANDALTYIEHLEADREALLKIAHDYAGCSECIHMDNKPELPPCSDCGVLGKNWVWRGAGKEQTNENA